MHALQTLDAQTFNVKLAEALKKYKEIESPEWVLFVKSGHGKQRPINEEDFWYKRCASILRQLYLRGGFGVRRLRTRYGNRKNRGKQPAHFVRSSGKIIRMLLQQSEKAGLIAKATGKEKGRVLTDDGKKLLEGLN